jgi:hypothetical protein
LRLLGKPFKGDLITISFINLEAVAYLPIPIVNVAG